MQWESDWNTVLTEVTAMCDSNSVSVTSAQIGDARMWFDEAIASHQADSAVHPGNAAWNSTWIAHYQQLDAMYAALP